VVQRGLIPAIVVSAAACHTPPPGPAPTDAIAASPAATTGAATAAVPLAPAPSMATPADTIAAIARDIEGLKPACPQLVDFDREKHVDRAGDRLDYGYHTHPPARRGGWAGAVPNPDPDGVWLYIDIHDPASMSQIHTQPVVPKLRVGDKLLMMLILEGDRVPSCAGKLWAVLGKYGKGPSF
jgi:hypothetical protein